MSRPTKYAYSVEPPDAVVANVAWTSVSEEDTARKEAAADPPRGTSMAPEPFATENEDVCEPETRHAPPMSAEPQAPSVVREKASPAKLLEAACTTPEAVTKTKVLAARVTVSPIATMAPRRLVGIW
jgi:hypothetical protein